MTARFPLDADLDLALRLADAAREISLARFRGPFQKRLKADGSIVTEVDEAVEDELRERLARERPRDAILGEERGASGDSERRWIIDAIDGTLSFAAGKSRDSLSFDELRVRVLTPDFAYATARFKLTRPPRDSVVASGPFTLVLQRQGDRWRILHDHTSADPR